MAKQSSKKLRQYLLSGAVLTGILAVGLLAILIQKDVEFKRTQASDPKLTVSGTTVIKATGERFIFEGVNLEYFRDKGCSYVTEKAILQKNQIVQKYKDIGINAVRFNYRSSWLGESTNADEFISTMQLFAQNGIYVMPSDHSYTGKDLAGFETTSFPLFKKIVEGARARGFEDYLIINPYNEPYGADSTSTWPNWLASNKKTLDYLRRDLGFKGVVVLDTKGWASSFDIPSLKEMVTYDAGLLGKANLVFSNHWYPNHDYTSRVKPTLDAANQVPVLIGELGRINPGSTGVVDSYPRDLVRNVVGTGINNGHNGIFPWMWAWCDANNMTAAWDDLVNLSSYGQMYVDEYFSKVNGGSAPTLVPSSTPAPTGGVCQQICNFEDPNRCPAGSVWAGWQDSYSNDVVTVCSTSTPTAKPTVAPTASPAPTVAPTAVPTAKPTVAPTAAPISSTGDGLIGNYYNNMDFTSLGQSRVDKTINFNWNYGSPIAGTISSDTFSIVWTGFFSVPVSGDYTFSAQSDDGVRLYVNNKLVIDNWRDQAFTEKWFRVSSLTAGKKYPIKIEYYDNRASAAMKLFWQGPVGAKEIVPQKYLYTK